MHCISAKQSSNTLEEGSTARLWSPGDKQVLAVANAGEGGAGGMAGGQALPLAEVAVSLLDWQPLRLYSRWSFWEPS